MNANVLDYLLVNPYLIPEEWKKDKKNNILYIFFWGTIYRSSDGNLSVRYLYWNKQQWGWGYLRIDYGWETCYPAVLIAN